MSPLVTTGLLGVNRHFQYNSTRSLISALSELLLCLRQHRIGFDIEAFGECRYYCKQRGSVLLTIDADEFHSNEVSIALSATQRRTRTIKHDGLTESAGAFSVTPSHQFIPVFQAAIRHVRYWTHGYRWNVPLYATTRIGIKVPRPSRENGNKKIAWNVNGMEI